MRLLLALALAAALGLSACGSEEATEPAGSTGGSGPEAGLPDVARLICEPNGTRLETPAVKPRADGVHFEIVNETGSDRSFSVLDGRRGGVGENAPVGTSTKIVALGPGPLTVTCSVSLADVEQGPGSRSSTRTGSGSRRAWTAYAASRERSTTFGRRKATRTR